MMNGSIVLDKINYGDLVECDGLFLDRFYAKRLKLDYVEYDHDVELETDIGLNFMYKQSFHSCHIYVRKTETDKLSNLAKELSLHELADCVCIYTSARYLERWENGIKIGKTCDLSDFYSNLREGYPRLSDVSP